MTRADDELIELEERLVARAVVRLRARVMAVVFGTVGGAGLFSATVWLVVRGGEQVGLHLGLLEHYFPGYSVTWPGAFVGLGYGSFVGAVVGWTGAWVYNRVAREPAVR